MMKTFLFLFVFLLSSWAQAQQYDSKGKRDPFVSLRNLQQDEAPRILEPPPLEKRPPGLSGLLISEVNVTGMAANNTARIVILKGTDSFTYFAREGSKLFDGYLAEISTDRVTFVRELVDTRGNKKTTRVVKRLYTEDHQVNANGKP